MREALYGLDRIASERNPARAERSLEARMERLMLAEPGHWQRYYGGTPSEQRLLRHFSYSDRIRYYWPAPEARAAVAELHRRARCRADRRDARQPVPAALLRGGA